jgi:hypothetical protein
MTREQWIDYYESINGHKPSVLEVAEAEKNGEISIISESSTPTVIESDDYITSQSHTYCKNSIWRSLWTVLTFIFRGLWWTIRLAFSVALFLVNIILTIFFFFVRITGLIFFLSR